MLMGLIAALIGRLLFLARMKKCLLVDITGDVEAFEYKGKTYDKRKFVTLQANAITGMKLKDLQNNLNELESELVRSKTPDLDMALIEAYKVAISKK